MTMGAEREAGEEEESRRPLLTPTPSPGSPSATEPTDPDSTLRSRPLRCGFRFSGGAPAAVPAPGAEQLVGAARGRGRGGQRGRGQVRRLLLLLQPLPLGAQSPPRRRRLPPVHPQRRPLPIPVVRCHSSARAWDVLDEVEIRHLLIEHVGHRCCWGSRPARTWKITSIEDCNVYVGTLETFIEERDTILKKEPYDGGKIDGRDKGPVLGVWELDLRSEFPMLFVPEKEVMVKIPHSEITEKCLDCEGRGEAPCPTCNAGQQHGFYKANQMTRCSVCHGRGLLAHQDGSDSVCGMCNGQGMLPCIACASRGLVTCQTCNGCGSLLAQSTAHVRWKTLTARKVSATTGAASVPDEVFHRAQGVQLCNIQAYQCTPAFFADSYPLNQFSSEIVASRLPVPPSARVISERHIISVVPVTRVTMSHRKRSFSFYVVGYGRDVFIRDYPSKFCWGLCRCFEWLGN